MKAVTELLPGAVRALELHAAELSQKDELCGAFWGTLMLRQAGVSLGAAPLDQDAVAVAAGTLISDRPHDEDRPAGAPPRRDYRLRLPLAGPGQEAGTSATGVARAVGRLSDGELVVLPVHGPWREATLRALLAAAAEAGERASLVANVGTRFLWPSRTAPAELARYLLDGEDRDLGPEWDVGHFVGLLGTVSGARGTAVVVADTYPQLGVHGVHVQPMPQLLRAIERPGQHGGGVLLAVPAAVAAQAERRLVAAGASIGLWDNGSPDVAEDAAA